MSQDHVGIDKTGVIFELREEIRAIHELVHSDPNLTTAESSSRRYRSMLADMADSIARRAAADAVRLEMLRDLIDDCDKHDAVLAARMAAVADCYRN